MMNNTPSGAKKHRKSTKPESRMMAKMFFFPSSSSPSSSDRLVHICVTLPQWFSHKTAAFSNEQCTSPSGFFAGLKCDKAVWTAHWGTMASFATTIFFTCMHAHKTLSNEMLLLRKIAELEIETAHIMVFKVPIMLCSNSQCQINFFNFFIFLFYFLFLFILFFLCKTDH